MTEDINAVLDLNKLRKKVEGRTVAIVAQGSSIYELERRILEFKDYDICWTSFNLYSPIEKLILSKINKKLEIVLEAADSDNNEYEENYRIPKLKEVMDRGDLVLSTWRLLRTEYEKKGLKDFYENHVDNIVLADHLLKIITVSNTLCILIYCAAVCKPKRIVLFGVDGYKGASNEREYPTYYHPDLAQERRERLLKHRRHFSLIETSTDFENDFTKNLEEYCKQNNSEVPEILNCSPISIFNCIKKINYNELKEELDNE